MDKKNLNNNENPREKGKKLKGNLKDYWRYRVGKYRIITEINFVFEVLLNFIIFYLSSISLPYYTNSYSK